MLVCNVCLCNGPGHRRLPYLEAYVAEVQRVASLVFIGGVRCAGQDATIHGYFIPKVGVTTCAVKNIPKQATNCSSPHF